MHPDHGDGRGRAAGLTVQPADVDATPGAPVRLAVAVDNHLGTPQQFQVRLVGAEASWSGESRLTPRLDPGEQATLEVDLTLPLGFPHGEHLMAVEAVPVDDAGVPVPGERRIADVIVRVGTPLGVHAVMAPAYLQGGRRARTTVSLRNRSQVPLTVSMSAASPGDEVRVRFSEDQVTVPPGHVVPVRAKVRGPRLRPGRRRRVPFSITAATAGRAVHLDSTFQQRPLLGPTLLKALAILTVVAVWAATLAVVLERVGDDDPDEAVAEQASAEGGADGSGSGDDGSASDGSGGDGSGDGAGAGDELEGRDAGAVDASGKVSAREPAGVEVRIRSVSLVDEISQGANFVNDPRATSGAVKLFGRRGGAIFNRAVPAERTTTTDEDGRWGFSGVTGPGFYEIRFSKPGYQTAAYVVEAPEDGSPIALDAELTAGDGTLSGRAVGPDGEPLGGVDISATDGVVTLSSRTATTGDVGSWSIEGLSTPGSYLVTAERRGYGTATQLVRLEGSQSRGGIDIALEPGVGTILGEVTSPEGPLGGLTVTATDGEVTRTTSTLTEGPVGSFALPQLPVPGIYTLTVEGDGWLTQTRDVELTAGDAEVALSMVADTATIHGRLRDQAGSGIGGAGITAVSEERTFKSTTAPDGTYELDGLPPGTYVIEFQRFEYHPGSALVTVGAGGIEEVDIALDPRDRLAPDPDNTVTVNVSAEGVDAENIYVRVTDRTSGQTAETGGTSSAQLFDLAPGVHVLDVERVDHPDSAGLQPTTAVVRVGLQGAYSVSVVMKPLVIVDVVVRDVAGGTLTGAHVLVNRTNPPCPPDGPPPDCPMVDEPTGAEGRLAEPAQLPDGTFDATVTLDGYVTRTVTFSTNYDLDPSTEVEVVLDKLAVIELDVLEPTATGGYRSLSGVEATVRPSSGSAVTVVTDDNPYLVEGLLASNYTIELRRDGYLPIDAGPYLVALNQTRTVQLVMVPDPGTTTGRVIWEPDGAPARVVPGASVTIEGIAEYDRVGDGATTTDGTWTTTSGADGRYSFDADNGPVFGDADVTATHPDFGSASTTGRPVGTDLGDLALDPLPGDLEATVEMAFGDDTAAAIRADAEDGASGDYTDFASVMRDGLQLRIVDSPGGALDGDLVPMVGSSFNATGTEVHASVTVQAEDVPAGPYVVEAFFDHPTAPYADDFTPTQGSVFVAPNGTVESPLTLVVAERAYLEVDVAYDAEPHPDAPLGGTTTLELRDGGGALVESVDVPAAGLSSTHTFGPIEPGAYLVSVARDGYALRTAPGAVTLGVGGRGTLAYELAKQGTVRARLVGVDTESTESVFGAGVAVELTDADTGVVVGAGSTDADGRVVFTGLPAGDYTLTPDATGYDNEAAATTFTVEPDLGGVLGDVDLGDVHVEVKPVGLVGRVLSTSGTATPPDGVVLRLYRGNNVVATSDGDAEGAEWDGNFDFTGLNPGNYTLTVEAPNHYPHSQSVNMTTGGVDTDLGTINLTYATTHVHGWVRVRVGADDDPGLACDDLDATATLVISATESLTDDLDADCNYGFDDIEEGTYHVEVTAPGFRPVSSGSFTVDLDRSLGQHRVDPMVLVALHHTVTVTVTSAVGDAAVDGARVSLAPQTGSTGSAAGPAATDGDGDARLTNVVPGTYDVTIDGSDAGHVSTTAVLEVPFADPATEGSPPETTLAVEIPEGLVTGVVALSDGTVPHGVDVTITDAADAEVATLSPDADGEFAVYLPPATGYELHATYAAWGEHQRPATASFDLASGETEPAGTTAAPLEIVRTAGLTVQVTPTGATLAATTSETGQPDVTVTDGGPGDEDGEENGVIVVTDLLTGTYDLEVSAGDDYVPWTDTGQVLSGGMHTESVTLALVEVDVTITVTGDAGTWTVTFDGSSTTGSSPFEFAEVAVGTYTVEVCTNGNNCVEEDVTVTATGANAFTVDATDLDPGSG